ncbi:hypothetical protein CGRA01v4_06391 [Colletotrichum graminicola]|nr:hypothetical protein CGRA01v4_06391 [Colletotrichum graminicola]
MQTQPPTLKWPANRCYCWCWALALVLALALALVPMLCCCSRGLGLISGYTQARTDASALPGLSLGYPLLVCCSQKGTCLADECRTITPFLSFLVC